MDSTDMRAELIAHIADLDERAALDVVGKLLEKGVNPMVIVDDCQNGMQQVGERYEAQEYFLSGLIMAGEISRRIMEKVQPIIESELSGDESGRVLLGTVQGDIHDIGKGIVSLLLNCYGFTVHDIGVDQPPAEFLIQASQIRPDIIGLSALLTSSYSAMRETVHLIRSAADIELSSTPIIIGGPRLTERDCDYVGADYWVTEAMAGVRLCQAIMTHK